MLECNFTNHIGTFITSNEVEKGLKVTKKKMVKAQEKVTLNQSFTSTHPESSD